MLATDVLQTSPTLGLSFALGVGLHVFLFRHGEWDLSAIRLITVFTLVFAGIVGATAAAPALAPFVARPIDSVDLLDACRAAGIYASMLVYRGCFHRLNRFPGPFMARFSNLNVTFKIWNRMHLHEDVRKLHEKYGDVDQRNSRSTSPAPSTPCSWRRTATKARGTTSSTQWSRCRWSGTRTRTPGGGRPGNTASPPKVRQPPLSPTLITTMLTTKSALREYEPRVLKYTSQLLAGIASSANTPLNASLWFNFYSFDVMGEFSLGRGFRMLEDGESHLYMDGLHRETLAVGRFTHAMWALPLYRRLSMLWDADLRRFKAWVARQVGRRIGERPDAADIFTWVLEDYEARGSKAPQDLLNLFGDCILITVAGSDTVAAVLSCLFMELARHPDEYEKLQGEVDEYFRHHDKPEHAPLSKLRYLQACIDEALRLHPPVPSGVQRMTPPEGLQVDDVWLPGDTIVFVPSYTQYRGRTSCFVDAECKLTKGNLPDEFIPERWIDRPELVKNATPFVPFSTGHDVCIGKQLGLLETRFVVSAVVHEYNVRYAEGQTGEKFLEDNKDTGTLTVGPLNLVFTPREA
ncbi:cytochrome p450 [Colletotrichum sojae]|uniref:Cytochrome p450 n=1 Tax=Colletotrichum sojae TaxID=2175907 RepID=A0A8H6MRJ3_9PEZI|nr:cytochrome p450 [Colletotrichum sojae]